MEPKLVQLGPMRIAGIGGEFISNLVPGTNASKIIPELWDRFIARQSELAPTDPEVSFGVMTGCGDLNRLRYVAGAEVSPASDAPQGMDVVEVAGGNYAVYTHTGPIWELARTTSSVYREWLPKSGLTVRDAPHLELYDSRFNPSSPDSELDILIPIV